MGAFFVSKHAGSTNDTGYSRRRAGRKIIVSDCEPLPTPPAGRLQADAKRRAEHEQKVAQQRAAAAEKRAKKELDKLEREKKEDEQRQGGVDRPGWPCVWGGDRG